MKYIFSVVFTFVVVLVSIVRLLFGKKTDTNLIRVFWWKETTTRRIADFCAKIDNKCADRTYSARNEKRLERTRFFVKLLRIRMRLDRL
jgi:hypothetical protein